MKNNTLNNLIPSYFRIVGYFLAVGALLTGLYFKLFSNRNLGINSFIIPHVLILIGFLLVVSSKAKIEDERITIIRLQVWNQGYWLMIGFIIGQILLSYSFSGTGMIGAQGTLTLLIGIAAYQTIVFELSKNGDFMDWLEHNKTKYYVVFSFLLASFYILHQWFWYA